MRLLFIALVCLALSNCAHVWPSNCPLTDGERKCKCDVSWKEILRPHSLGKPRPACQAVYHCDGKPLPITVDAEDCGR